MLPLANDVPQIPAHQPTPMQMSGIVIYAIRCSLGPGQACSGTSALPPCTRLRPPQDVKYPCCPELTYLFAGIYRAASSLSRKGYKILHFDYLNNAENQPKCTHHFCCMNCMVSLWRRSDLMISARQLRGQTTPYRHHLPQAGFRLSGNRRETRTQYSDLRLPGGCLPGSTID